MWGLCHKLYQIIYTLYSTHDDFIYYCYNNFFLCVSFYISSLRTYSKAAAPEMISINSLVITACLVRLNVSVSLPIISAKIHVVYMYNYNISTKLELKWLGHTKNIVNTCVFASIIHSRHSWWLFTASRLFHCVV